MKIILLFLIYLSYVGTCYAAELDIEKELLFLPVPAPEKALAKDPILEKLCEQISKSDDLALLKEVTVHISNASYAEKAFSELLAKEIGSQEIQRELLLDLLYKLHTGKNPYPSFALRLSWKKSYQTSFDKDPTQLTRAYKDSLLSEKDSVDLALKYMQDPKKEPNLLYAGLIFSKGLKTPAAQKLLTTKLREVAEQQWGFVYLEALTQLLQYDPGKVNDILQEKVSSPHKFDSESYTGTAKIVYSEAVLSDHQRVNYLLSLYEAEHKNKSVILSFLIELAKKDSANLVMIKNKIPRAGSIVDLKNTDQKTILNALKTYDQSEALVALHEILESHKLDNEIAQWILKYDWNENSVGPVIMSFQGSKNPVVPDLLLANAGLILEGKQSEIREALLWLSLTSEKKVEDKDLIARLATSVDTGSIGLKKPYREIAAIISLGIKSGDQTFQKIIKNLLDESHPVYTHFRKNGAKEIYNQALFEVGNSTGLATECLGPIVDGLKSLELMSLNVSAAAALRSWPNDKDIPNELQQAISLNLIDSGNSTTRRNTPTLMIDLLDNEKNISTKYLLLEFIEAGGLTRIVMFKEEIQKVSETKGTWENLQDGSVYADKLLKMIE